VVFHSVATNLAEGDTNPILDVFVRDMVGGSTHLVSRNALGLSGNGSSFSAVISADGSRIAFESRASDLVEGDANQQIDVFVTPRPQ
jgi:Tol biopolymer transport system component